MSENVIRKVRALLDRAANTQFPEEAQTCRETAERLMVKYTIDEAMVEASAVGGKTKPGSMEVEFTPPHINQMAYLMNGIANVFNCKLILMGKKDAIIYGFESDLDAVWTLWESLYSQLMNELVAQGPGSSSFKKSFMMSFSLRVHDRLEKFYKTAVEEGEPGTALVLRDRKTEVEALFHEKHPYTSSKRMSGGSDWAGHTAGTAAGARADIGMSGRTMAGSGAALGA